MRHRLLLPVVAAVAAGLAVVSAMMMIMTTMIMMAALAMNAAAMRTRKTTAMTGTAQAMEMQMEVVALASRWTIIHSTAGAPS